MATILDTVMVVPTYEDPSWTQNTTLDGTTFQLDFTYNSRCQCYYLDVYDLEGEAIYLGVKIICGSALLRKCADIDRAPPGDFWCFSNTGDKTPPGLGELAPGARCQLLYFPVSLIP
jgi:hypothetical protein